MLRSVSQSRRHALRRGLLTLAGLGLTAYFAVHAATGRHGIDARSRLSARLPAVQTELAALEARRTALMREVAQLTADPPPPDMVEEVARRVLGYAYPQDTVVIGR